MSGNRTSHIRLTSHPGGGSTNRFPITWDAATARERGPVVATANAGADRNAMAPTAAPIRSTAPSPWPLAPWTRWSGPSW